MSCPLCGSTRIRTFSYFNKESDRWEWWNGCNDCTWQARNESEEASHPEYYTRTDISPAKISTDDDLNKRQ